MGKAICLYLPHLPLTPRTASVLKKNLAKICVFHYHIFMGDDDILKRLDRIAEGIEGILAVMSKPESKIKKALEMAGYGIAILGAVSIVDIIRNWITGG